MATHCEDVSARMMELLYGELSADERASMDAHIAGCARCRSELEGFQKTRAVARQALDETPPARVRAAIVKAAAEHLAAQAQPAARKPAAPDKMSFWDRIRRAWALPTLAAVGAFAVFLVANRVFQNPERALQTAAPTAAAPEAAPERTRLDETAQKGARFEQQDRKAITTPTDLPRGGDQRPAAASGRLDEDGARPPAMHGAASAGAPALHRSIGDDAQEGYAERPRGERKAEAIDGLSGGKAMAAPAPVSESAKASRDQPQFRSNREFAPPPPPREAPAPAKAGGKAADKATAGKDFGDNGSFEGGESRASGSRREAAAQAAPAPAESLDDLANARPGKAHAGGGAAGPALQKGDTATTKRPAPPVAAEPASAPAPATAPASPPPPPAAKVRLKSSPTYDAEESEAAPAEAKKEKKPSAGKAGPAETLAQRADRLFTEGRWNEAAAAYRELLRRDPRNDDADRWRQRLLTAENADVNERVNFAERRAAEAKAAKTAAPKAAKAAKKASSAIDADR